MMDCYEIVTNIGKGSSGAVYLARSDKTKRPVAIKKIIIDESRRSRCRKSVMREANIMLSLDHSHIVKCYEWFLDEQNEENISMVLEFCNGGTLQERILNTKLSRSQISEDQIGRWTTQITSAVDYIHQRRILHRDLKSENVFLLKDDTIKLGDFGISKDLNHTLDKANTCVGTPCYLSPELCQDIPYSFKSDIWALGCLVFEMCALKPAFDAANLISLFHKIVNCSFADMPITSSPHLKEFIAAILVADPGKRPTAAELLKMDFLRPYHLHIGESTGCAPVKVEKLVEEEPDWSALDDLDELLKTSEDAIQLKQQIAEERRSSASSQSSEACSDRDVTTAGTLRRNHENEEDSINGEEGWSDDDSDSTFDEINSQTLNSSKGLDDEIPEIIEVMEEVSTAASSNNIASSSGGFGNKLPGSIWLHSKRAQALRQRNPPSSPAKIITGVQRQKPPTNPLRHSCDVTSTAPSSNCDVTTTATAITSSKPSKRTSSLGSDKSGGGDATPRISPNHPPPRSVRPPAQAPSTTDVNVRNLPGSAWLYGKKQREEQTEVAEQDDVDDFGDDDYDDDDFEDEDDDIITIESTQFTSSIQHDDDKT